MGKALLIDERYGINRRIQLTENLIFFDIKQDHYNQKYLKITQSKKSKLFLF